MRLSEPIGTATGVAAIGPKISVPSGAGTLRVGTQSRAVQVPLGRASIREDFTMTFRKI